MALDDYMAEIGGYEFPLPKIAGTYSGRLVICADAACVWDDLERLGYRKDLGRGRVAGEGHFMVVNKLGEVFPGDIEHWYSNEGEWLADLVKGRRKEYRKEFEPPKHTHSVNRGARWRWPFRGFGTSGLNAILVGLALGYDDIVLCGMPLENGPHNGEPHWRGTRFTREVSDTEGGGINRHWRWAIEKAFDGRVKSMSGRTRQWLGAPC